MKLAFLGATFKSTELHFRKAKMIFDLGKHTLNLATTQKDVQSAGNILSRAKQQLDQAWDSLKKTARSGNRDDFPEHIFKQLIDLSIDVAEEHTKYLSKMASMDGLGLDDWRKTLISKTTAAASRRASYEKGFPERAIAWSRALKESMAKTIASREQLNIPALPEEDPIKSFRESIDMALDNARQGESRAAFSHLEKALVKSRSFQNPEFADSVLAMTRWFISRRAEKTLANKVQSIKDSLSRAMETIDEGNLSTAALYTDYAEKTVNSIPPAMSGPFKRLIATVDRLIHSKAIEVAQSRAEIPIQEIHNLQLKWSGALTPKQEKRLEKTERTLKRDWLQPHLKFTERTKGFHDPKKPRGRVLTFPIDKVLQKIENNLTLAKKILPVNDIRATNLIRQSQDFLELVVRNAPHWQWNVSIPESVVVTDENVLLYDKAAQAHYEEFVRRIGNLADRITTLAKQTKMLGPMYERAMRELEEGSK